MNERIVWLNHDASHMAVSDSIGDSGNKICQWLCCSCGQDYGSIKYTKMDTMEELGNIDEEEERNILKRNLQHYDLGDHRPKEESGYTYDKSKEGTDYGNQSRISNRTEGSLQCGATKPIPSRTRDLTIENESRSDLGLQSEFNNPSEKGIILSIPTRFVCRRCHHMMCPYCKKIRLKDLPEVS